MTFVHVRHVATVTFAEADQDPTLGSNVTNRKPCLAAVVPFRTAQWCINRSRFKLAGVFQMLQQHCLFTSQLGIHGQMLQAAGATVTEMRAAGLDPVGGWLQYFQRLNLAPLAAAKQVAYDDFFTRQGIVYLQHFSFVFGQTHTLGIK